jgi:hypothetical protein
MSDEKLKGQGIEVPTGVEGLPDTAHAPGAGPERRPLDEARAGKPEAAPAPQQKTAAGPTAGAGAAGRRRKAAPRVRVRSVRLDPQGVKLWGIVTRRMEGHAPDLVQKLINGEMAFREAIRAQPDGPDGPPVGDPARVTDALVNALYLADSIELSVGLEDGMAICLGAYLLLRRGLDAQSDQMTTADALHLALMLEEAVGLEDGKVVCDVAYSLLRRRLAYHSGTAAAVAAPGRPDTA